MSQSVSRIPRRNADAGFRVLDGQALIAVAGRSEVHLLNDVGTRIWELLDGEKCEEAITTEIAKEFEVSAEVAATDLREFLDDLTSKGMTE